jgi:hypothetical protein
MASTWRRTLVPATYLVITVVWAWPLPLHLTNRFTHDPGDPLLVTYLMWWNAHAIPLTRAWWNAPFFWPMADALAVTEHLAGLSPISTPIQLLGGSALLAYNIIVILSTWWSGLATHALIRRLTGHTAAAFCGGIAFALAPYRTSQLGHMQLYACWWLPVALLSLHAYLDTGRVRWLAAFGVAWLLQALTNGYYLFFFPVFLAAWVAWFIPWRTQARKGVAIAATWVLFSLPLLPVLLKYYRVQQWLGVSRTRGEMMYYSAEWKSFLCATPILRFWHTAAPATTEAYLFPGITVVLLLIIGAPFLLRRKTSAFYVLATVMTAWLCFGPTLVGLSPAALWHPYDWLVWLPGFSGLRVPARFFMFASLCLAVSAGLTVAHLTTRAPRARILAGLVVAGLWIDGAIAGMPLGVPPGALAMSERGARLLALPYDDPYVTVRTMYQSMGLVVPVVNGYGGYIPSHADVIRWALVRHDPSILTELRRGHPLYVIVASTGEADAWSRFMDAQHEAEMLGVSGGGRVYRMSPSAFAHEIHAGARIEPVSVDAQAPWITADLGSVKTARVLELRTHGGLVRLPAVILIESSRDGVTWTRDVEQAPGGPALIGALAAPQVVPLRLVLPDIQARFIRINASEFGPRAITIFGP